MAEKTFTLADVSKHNTEDDMWIIINGLVYDVTEFLPDHPGGKKTLLRYAGLDGSKEFNTLHKPDVIQKYLDPSDLKGKLAPQAKL